MRRHIGRVAITGLMLVTTFPVRASAAEPETTRAVLTEHDVRREKLRYNQRTMGEAYEKVGKRDPKWDEPARKFLDAMALRFSNANARLIYELPGMVSIEEARKLGQAAMDSGCDDPLVKYMFITILADMNEKARAQEMLGPVVEELFASKYPVIRASNAAMRYYRGIDAKQQPGESTAAWSRFAEAVGAVISADSYEGMDRRFLFDNVQEGITRAPLPQRRWLCDQLEQNPKADPWLMHAIVGDYRVDAAWAARGSGWAHTVNEQGWEDFAMHLSKARDHLTAAWKAHPEHPEPPTRMIAVAMGGSDLEENPRVWFDRAQAGQFDYIQAYKSYLWNLRPRWNGSHAEMMEFGRECARTERYDTLVPYQYIEALEDVTGETGPPGMWRVPIVYEQAREVLKNYAEKSKHEGDRRWYGSYHTAAAWRSGNYDEACELIEAMGDKLEMTGFERFGVLPRLAISNAYGMRGERGKELARAEAEAAAGQYNEAAKTYADAMSKLAGDDKGAMFIRGRARELALTPKYLAGEWIDIQPDKNMSLWYTIAGEWQSDGSALTGKYTDGAIVFCHAGFVGQNYEMTGTVEFAPEETVGKAGPVVVWENRDATYSVLLRRNDQDATVLRAQYRHSDSVPAEVGLSNAFRAKIFENTLNFWVNDKHVVKDAKIDAWLGEDRRRFVGCCLRHANPGTSARFKDLKLRSLDVAGAGEQEAPAEQKPAAEEKN